MKQLTLVGPTIQLTRQIMVEGESGLLNVFPPEHRPEYKQQRGEIHWPNGAIAYAVSAEEPERLRGLQHEIIWADELAAWSKPKYAWDMLMYGLRLGNNPQVCITTTPKPIQLLRDLIANPNCTIVKGSTYENLENLAGVYRDIIEGYKGTRLGRQELYAEILEDIEGALWQSAWIDENRVKTAPESLRRIVVAIDPATTQGEDSDFTGIAVAGKGNDDHFYLLHCEGVKLSPQGWAKRALELFDQFQADRLIAERNNGGEMVEHTLRTIRRTAPIKTVHASRGKQTRAEPCAALYEQGRVHHVGVFPTLEDQLTRFPVATENDDEVDAVVYALNELSGRGVITFS